MVKVKNKKGISSERVHNKKDQKKSNPFEVHINKEKFKVIGKKQKNDRGLPGISRAKSIQKRKSTLLEEYKVQNKSNKFLDRRIGEKNNMDSEEKAIARFTALKMKSHSKKNIFNLADDEILTHKGQTLSEIEKFDDPRSDDDFSDIEDSSNGKLDRNFVEEAHFGGGILKNTGKEGAMTHKDLINQLIIESKKRKAEKQKTKEVTLELTEKLDSDWKDLIPLVTKDAKNKEEAPQKHKVDDYDKVMRELKFEKRGTVSDRLKTEEEIAKEEKESLEQLEQERIKRMYNTESDGKPQYKHRSADDLDDDFVYDNDEDVEENMLSYDQKGESNLQIEANVNGTIIKAKNGNIERINNDNNSDKEDEKGSSDEEEVETESEDNLSDLKEDEIDSEEDENEKQEMADTLQIKNISVNDEIRMQDNIGKMKDKIDTKMQDEIEWENKMQDDIVKVKDKIDTKNQHEIEWENKVSNKNVEFTEKIDLPFTFKLPDSYDSLIKTFEEYGYQHVVIERMIKCNHPSLSEQNKSKLGLLFAYLLQYVNDLFYENLDKNEMQNNFKIFKNIIPQIYELAQLNPENAHNSVLEVIKEKFEEYKKRPKTYPGLEILVFLKVVSILFPTSDFRHQIVTPCYTFMELMLSRCRVLCRRDISYGLFISTLVLEYSVLSKRYLPAVINYLSGLLHMAVPKTSVRLLKIPPPFKSTSSLLVLTSNCSLESVTSLKLESTDFCEKEITSEFQIRVLHNVVKLLLDFFNNYKLLPSHVEIFENVRKYSDMIPLSNYPQEVQSNMKNLINTLQKAKEERKLEYLVVEASKPKALRLYEPKIQVVFDGKQHKYQSKEKAQMNKLLHKVKREKKGALREIRRDNSFLGRVKINRQIKDDRDRLEKVKRIYSEASIQQSELNAIDRKKKRKH